MTFTTIKKDPNPITSPSDASEVDTDYWNNLYDILAGTSTDKIAAAAITDSLLENQATYIVRKNGSNYEAIASKTGTITTNSDFAALMNIIIGTGDVEIFVKNSVTAQTAEIVPLRGTNITGTKITFEKGTLITLAQGYTGKIFHLNTSTSRVIIDGGKWIEGGTPQRLWTGLHLEATDIGGPIFFNTFRNVEFYDVGTGINLETNGATNGWINANAFENIIIQKPNIGVVFTNNGNTTATPELNKFKFVIVQSAANTTYCYKNISGTANEFFACDGYDPPSNCTGITANALDTLIIGGNMAQSVFTDNGTRTRIWGAYNATVGSSTVDFTYGSSKRQRFQADTNNAVFNLGNAIVGNPVTTVDGDIFFTTSSTPPRYRMNGVLRDLADISSTQQVQNKYLSNNNFLAQSGSTNVKAIQWDWSGMANNTIITLKSSQQVNVNLIIPTMTVSDSIALLSQLTNGTTISNLVTAQIASNDPLLERSGAYIVRKNGSNYEAINCHTGVKDSINTDAAVVINYCINNANGEKIILKKAEYDCATQIIGDDIGFCIVGDNVSETSASTTGVYIKKTGTQDPIISMQNSAHFPNQHLENVYIDGVDSLTNGINVTQLTQGNSFTNVEIIRCNYGMKAMYTIYQNWYNLIITNCATACLWMDYVDHVGNTKYCNTTYLYGGRLNKSPIGADIRRAEDVKFFGTIIEGNTVNAVSLDSRATKCIFDGCSFESNGTPSYVAVLDDGISNSFVECRFASDQTYTPMHLTANCRNSTFIDNDFQTNTVSTTQTILIDSGVQKHRFISNKKDTKTVFTITVTNNSTDPGYWYGQKAEFGVYDTVAGGLLIATDSSMGLFEQSTTVLRLGDSGNTTLYTLRAQGIQGTDYKDTAGNTWCTVTSGTNPQMAQAVKFVNNGIILAGAGAGLGTLTYANSASSATITFPATTGTIALLAQLTDGSTITGLVNAQIASGAAIAFSKLAALTSANILVGNGSNVATSVVMSGDITIDNTGATSIGSGKVTNAMLAGSIAYSKLVLTTSIVNGDISASAAIAKSKIATSGTWVEADLPATTVFTDATATMTSAHTYTTKLLKVADIADSNANISLACTATTSAVDYITIVNAATANPAYVQLNATGSDSNVGIVISPKGTGKIRLTDGTDTTKICAFDFSGATPGITATIAWSFTTAKTLTFPNVTDTVAVIGTIQTFTAKQNFTMTGGTGVTNRVSAALNIDFCTTANPVTTVTGDVWMLSNVMRYKDSGSTIRELINDGNNQTMSGTKTFSTKQIWTAIADLAAAAGQIWLSSTNVDLLKHSNASILMNIVDNVPGRLTAQTAAATALTYTVPTQDSSYLISANVNVTTSTLHNFTVTCTYTDEGNTSRTLTLGFTQLTGSTLLTAITNATGAGPYESLVYQIRCKAGTTITIASVGGGGFTTVTYNIEGHATRLA